MADRNEFKPRAGDALIVVDVQRDFLPGGALGVTEGDAVIGPINHCIGQFVRAGQPVFFTRDWHPADHCSFQAQGGPWPPHCVAGTEGAEFAPALQRPREAPVISKGTGPDKDAYSGFEGTDLAARLHRAGVRRVVVGGLATDYCVLNTVRDARRHRFRVLLLIDGVRAVNLQPGDEERAMGEMRKIGVQSITSERVTVGA